MMVKSGKQEARGSNGVSFVDLVHGGNHVTQNSSLLCPNDRSCALVFKGEESMIATILEAKNALPNIGSEQRKNRVNLDQKDHPVNGKKESEYLAKEKEVTEIPTAATKSTDAEDYISLFYSDIMPLLVDNKPSVGDDAFVWLGSLIPLVADFINGKFTFETIIYREPSAFPSL
ncbi:hypothetical protein Tco_0132557 [Tanacetum coccineum]